MSFNLKDTSIHTKLKNNKRVSSIYRLFTNEYFESYGWETFLWQGDEIIGEYSVLNNVNDVLDLHLKIKGGLHE